MADLYNDFDNRRRRIELRHARLSHGYVAKLGDDKLIIFKPRPHRRRAVLGIVVLVLCAFVVFKGVVLAHLGSALYSERVAALAEGYTVERVAATILQPDVVSSAIAARLRPFFW